MTKARDLSKLLSTANGKIAGANLDVSFENIADTGTEGTKVASGTTAQRGTTAGQLRFNTQTGLAEYYTGTEFKVIDSSPTVTGISPLEVDSTAGGDITFTITGSNFQSGAVTKFIGNDATEITASTTTVTNSTTISAVIARSSFVGAKEPYDVRVINTSGLAGTLDNQINVDVSPTWSTASGTLATIYDDATGTHATVSATDADGDTISYSETGGTVLTTAGLTLNSATGAISGDPTDVASSTTYNFNLRATANSKTTDRAFSIVVNKGLVSSNLIGKYVFASGNSYSGSGSTVTNLISGGSALGNATLYNSPTYNSGNGTMGFNLSSYQDQQMIIPNSTSRVNFTLSLLVEFTGSNPEGRSYICDMRNGSENFDAYWLFDNNTGYVLSFGTENTGTISGGASNIGYKVWTITKSGTNGKFYIDNSTIASITNANSGGVNVPFELMGLQVGLGGTNYQSKGNIKAVLFYNSALSDAEVASNATILKSIY
jgi:hypothetical protein